jgi:8-oxo-dGTP pyrophosphatase MutT (NUDIX family)
MKWEYSAGIIPFRKEKGKRKYLLLLSALTRSELWEFPKGLIDKGESAREAAVREFKEETGYSRCKLIPGFKKVLKYFYRREGELIGKTVTYFLAEVKYSQVELSSESKDFVWVEFHKASRKIKHKNILDLLKQAQDYLESYAQKSTKA